MATYSWPGSLPQNPQENFSETAGVRMLSTSMDAGPAKLRRRGSKGSVMSLSFDMTTAQLSTFETFVQDTLKGTARFGFTHPRKATVVEVRLVPQGDGELYTVNYVMHGHWSVSMQMEVLP